MNTPAHLIFGLAAFGKPDSAKMTIAALAGALIPDVSLYVLSVLHLFVLGIEPEVVFGELYYSDLWQGIFRIDNSIVLWCVGLGLALVARSAAGLAFCLAALLHLCLDFLLHVDDGRAHFWPLSDWIFQSPVSYWDPNHHGALVGGVEIILCAVLTVWMWRRFHDRWVRAVIVLLAAAEALTGAMWAAVFA